MSVRVKKLVGAGLLETRSGINGQKLIRVSDYDSLRARAACGRPVARARLPAATPPIESSDVGNPDRRESLIEAQLHKTARQADLATLSVQQKRGTLVPIEEVVEAQRKCAETILRALEMYASKAEEVASACAKDGVAGARRIAKDTIAVRATIAAEMRKLAAD